jgi:hypothetical protein
MGVLGRVNSLNSVVKNYPIQKLSFLPIMNKHFLSVFYFTVIDFRKFNIKLI